MARIWTALVLLAVTAGGALGQEPPHRAHPRTVPGDTGMAGMPGMPADTSGHAGRPRQRMATPAGMTGTDMGMAGPLGISDARDGSGTAWQPDVTPMYALHRAFGRWSLMLHGNAFVQYIGEGSDRGEQQFGSVNWFMGMARRPLAGGDLALRGMLSLEPVTVGKCGYPDLLATGEYCDGRPLHDRQHPHDMFMEVAALYRRALTRSLAVELYGGPAGEPALGPVAYPHRVTALWSPLAPISHHWQDATHIAFGVLSGGVYGRSWKVEGSAFNGREPDENRFDFDLGPLDSFAGRVWLLPTERLAVQVSTGFLKQAERSHEGGRSDVHRTTASLAYHLPLASGRLLANTLVWGQNRAHGLSTSAVLLESSLDLDGRNIVFARGELAGKSGEDLAIEDQAPAWAGRVFRVGKLGAGYTRQFAAGGLQPGIGAELSLSLVPAALKPFYGADASPGFAVFASVRPPAMRMSHERAMARPEPPRSSSAW